MQPDSGGIIPTSQFRLAALEIVLLHPYKGRERKPAGPDARILVHFIARCEDWRYLNYRPVVIMAGGERFDLGRPAHDGKVGKDADVVEQFFGQLTFAQLEKIAQFPTINLRVGRDEFALSDDQANIVARFVDRLKKDEVEAAGAERERDGKVLSDWAAAQRDSRNAARKGSKGLMQRNYDREMQRRAEAIRDKYSLSPEQLSEIVGAGARPD